MQSPSSASASRSKLDSFLRILTVAFALTLVSVTTPLVVADHMGNHERGGTEAIECGTEAADTETGVAEDPKFTSVDPLRASIHRHEPRNK